MPCMYSLVSIKIENQNLFCTTGLQIRPNSQDGLCVPWSVPPSVMLSSKCMKTWDYKSCFVHPTVNPPADFTGGRGGAGGHCTPFLRGAPQVVHSWSYIFQWYCCSYSCLSRTQDRWSPIWFCLIRPCVNLSPFDRRSVYSNARSLLPSLPLPLLLLSTTFIYYLSTTFINHFHHATAWYYLPTTPVLLLPALGLCSYFFTALAHIRLAVFISTKAYRFFFRDGETRLFMVS